ncbi:MAG: alpha-galactosidase [Candidatus Acidiferrum sp.]
MGAFQKRLTLCCLVACIALLASAPAKALDNGLALTPPMGWNSWNKFQCNVSEELIKGAADAMVSSGMKDAGYQYVVIDDCWQVDRDAAGNIVVDAQRFPSGMKALGDYVHSKGLKFGIYSDAGLKTCAGRPGSAGHEYQDAVQYASWGVDYLKYDWCHTGKANAEWAYATMRDALKASGRPILFSMCEWGSAKPWLWAKDIGNMWRTTGDISDCWDCPKKDQLGFVKILDMQDGLETYAGPGHWNDPDMLEVGNGGMTITEYRAHFSLWCLIAAPLIAGNDLKNMTPDIKEILTNKEVIAVNQDALGMQGRRAKRDADAEVWVKQLKDGGRAVILFNRRASETSISFTWEQIGYPAHLSASVRDLWAKKDLGKFNGKWVATVPSHGVVMIKVMP